jgi:hypothetical protein
MQPCSYKFTRMKKLPDARTLQSREEGLAAICMTAEIAEFKREPSFLSDCGGTNIASYPKEETYNRVVVTKIAYSQGKEKRKASTAP